MTYDSRAIRALYRKLLTLYPREFSEQFGESMEQSFNDLCTEKRRTKSGLFSFVLWTFFETITGIIQEQLLSMMQQGPMKNILINLRSPALISLLLVLPFMMMEFVNRDNFDEGFPIPLFIIMWLLPVIFIVTLMPIVRTAQAGNSLMAHPIGLLVRVAILVFITWMWISLLMDQMPCFLGVPNCD